jgi:uncharacterized protein (DUF4415 family)
LRNICVGYGLVFHVPNGEEDARIRAGIAADPDTHEVGVEKFKASGDGWQTRINDVLRAHA